MQPEETEKNERKLFICHSLVLQMKSRHESKNIFVTPRYKKPQSQVFTNGLDLRAGIKPVSHSLLFNRPYAQDS